MGLFAIMCGGSPTSFALAQPVLAAMGRTVTHFGPVGAGQAAKATNQIMCAGIIEAVSEAMAFAKANGLPLDKLVETLGKGAGSSWYFVHRAPNMIREAYPPGFRVRLHAKDLGICHDMAAALGAELPVVERMLEQYAQLIRQGHGDEDISACFRLKDPLSPQRTIRRPDRPRGCYGQQALVSVPVALCAPVWVTVKLAQLASCNCGLPGDGSTVTLKVPGVVAVGAPTVGVSIW